ncbi:LexA family protein [Brevibacillus porteri]|uniref:LexA family protein n=1 Tax=Brevibacillus porteri TaxID=2126350 RepID=UPI003D1CC58A
MSLAQIIKEMEEKKGVKVDRSYISKLRKNPKYPASEEINKAFAEVTGGDPDKLIWEGYYETAPHSVKRILDKVNDFEVLVKPLIEKKLLNVEFDGYESIGGVSQEELNEGIDYANSLEFINSLDKAEKLELLLDLLTNLAIQNPSQYDQYISDLDQCNKFQVSEDMSSYSVDKMYKLPVLGTIVAGKPLEFYEYNDGYTLIDPDLLRGRDGFALRVKGDSMSGDRILDGDVVIVLKQEEVQPHEIAVVTIDGSEATLKRVKRQGDMVMLVSSNPNYEPMLYHSKDIKILGKVVEVKFWPNK